MKIDISYQINSLLKTGTESGIRQALELLKKAAYQDEDDEASRWLNENDSEDEDTDKEEASAPAKAKRMKRSDWQMPEISNPKIMAQFKQLVDQGYSPREASRMTGAHAEPYDFESASRSGVRPSKPSPKFLSDIMDSAKDYIGNYKKLQIKESSPEKNPVLYSRGAMDESHKTFDDALSSAVNKFKESDDFKNAPKFKRSAMLSKFKAGWANSPEGQEAAKQFGQGYEAHREADKARHNFLSEVGHAMTTGGVSGAQEHDISSEMAAQHAGGERDDEGVSQVSISKNPLASFAAKNPHLLTHIQEKMPVMSDRAQRLDSAKTLQPKEEKPKFVVRRKQE